MRAYIREHKVKVVFYAFVGFFALYGLYAAYHFYGY